MAIFHAVYNILWGDIINIPLPGGSTLGLSLLVLILVPSWSKRREMDGSSSPLNSGLACS